MDILSSTSDDSDARQDVSIPATWTCVTCCHSFGRDATIKAQCGCEWCRSCVDDRFRMAMQDESLSPPACRGKSLLLKSVSKHLPKDTAREFRAKRVELATKDKTYVTQSLRNSKMMSLRHCASHMLRYLASEAQVRTIVPQRVLRATLRSMHSFNLLPLQSQPAPSSSRPSVSNYCPKCRAKTCSK